MKPFDPFNPPQQPPLPPRPLRAVDPRPLDLLAQLLLGLTYGEMLRLAGDLHSDQETHEPRPIDIADQLYRWALRVGEKP